MTHNTLYKFIACYQTQSLTLAGSEEMVRDLFNSRMDVQK